jgi:type VI secretion system secreted protein Hcp
MALFDAFLKIADIPGESADTKHKGEIDVESFSFEVQQHGTQGVGTGGGAGKASFQDIHFVKKIDKSSPILLLSCASGKHIKEATLSVRKAGKDQLEYLKIKFTEVFVTSLHEEAGPEAPTELIAFDFGRIEIEYSTQRGGTERAGWDVKKNVKI